MHKFFLILLALLLPLSLSGCPIGDDDDDSSDDDDATGDDDDATEAPSMECSPSRTLSCGESWGDSTEGGSMNFLSYAGCVGVEYIGPERFIYYIANHDGPATITIEFDPDAGDLDLFMLGHDDVNGGCEGEPCLGESINTSGTESIDFTSIPGINLWFAVDTFESTQGVPFQATLTCN